MAGSKFNEIFQRLNDLENEVFINNISERLKMVDNKYREKFHDLLNSSNKNVESFSLAITTICKELGTRVNIGQFDEMNKNIDNRFKLVQSEITDIKKQNRLLVSENKRIIEDNKLLKVSLEELKSSVYIDKRDTRERLKNLSKEIESSCVAFENFNSNVVQNKHENLLEVANKNKLDIAELYKNLINNNKDVNDIKLELSDLVNKNRTNLVNLNQDIENCNTAINLVKFDCMEIANRNKINIINLNQKFINKNNEISLIKADLIQIANSYKMDMVTLNQKIINNSNEINLIKSDIKKQYELFDNKLLDVQNQISKSNKIDQLSLESNFKLLNDKFVLFQEDQNKKNLEFSYNHTHLLKHILITSDNLRDQQKEESVKLHNEIKHTFDGKLKLLEMKIKQNIDFISQITLNQNKIKEELLKITTNNLLKEQLFKNLEDQSKTILIRQDMDSKLWKKQLELNTATDYKFNKLEQNFQSFETFQNNINKVVHENGNKCYESIIINKNESLNMIRELINKTETGKGRIDRISTELKELKQKIKTINELYDQRLNHFEKEDESMKKRQNNFELDLEEFKNILSPFNLKNLLNCEVKKIIDGERRPIGQSFLKYFCLGVSEKNKPKYSKHRKNKSAHFDNFLKFKNCIDLLNFRDIFNDQLIKVKLLEIYNQEKIKLKLQKEAKFKQHKQSIKKKRISQNKANCEMNSLIKKQNSITKDKIKNRKPNQYVREIAYITQHRKSPRLKPFLEKWQDLHVDGLDFLPHSP